MAACMRKAGDKPITPMAVKVALCALLSELEKTHFIMSQDILDDYTRRALERHGLVLMTEEDLSNRLADECERGRELGSYSD